ncbi:uncharacterized protein AB675_4368 [Cyphellophora attinorum]|uniref:Xylanolytic transcriptional activator regulatory domain-containing protein n=1 Tax=Cyphellophora attinorum TaxID=1664694 RepID=A0A0N1NYD9_9EURO|nr:uncharacterized protein AB675_4368 [Phialophora attinorum]KPI36540.1 hypothetical protein AB675_4368 [Phialophora attinorum]
MANVKPQAVILANNLPTAQINQHFAPADTGQISRSTAYSLSFLDVALGGVEPADRVAVHEGLQALSSTLNGSNMNAAINAPNTKTYVVPSKPTGYSMIGHFLELAEMSQPFMIVPSEDIIRAVVFEPDTVAVGEPAWIVTVNYNLLAASRDSSRPCLPDADLRHNMQLALNHSSIFLKPSEANVQALAHLALHGEDFATPNVSWLLLSHACRQAEVISLHVPDQARPQESEQRLCLFWLLFIIDKSCALAFGRQPFLSSSAYSNVPLPSHDTLRSFQPHKSTVFGGEGSQSTEDFVTGAHFLTTGIAFARLIGGLVERGINSAPILNVQEQLKEWAEAAFKPLNTAMLELTESGNAAQQREVSLGIMTLQFQHLHAQVVLLKYLPEAAALRLDCARGMLELLPSVVSNHTSVYNGVVWHLLYYPFAAFFEVVAHVMSSSSSPILHSDIRLLQSLPTYFAEMRGQMRGALVSVCTRLQDVAAKFVYLAEGRVSSTAPSDTVASHPRPTKSGRGPGHDHTQGKHAREGLSGIARSLQSDETSTARDDNNVAHGILSSTASHSDNLEEADTLRMDSNFDWFAWDAYYSTQPNMLL